jgi:murein DD-endopeptidase MepM/ murein hydrolase activator NlpD
MRSLEAAMLAAALFVLACDPVQAFTAALSPAGIKPGDVFVLTVSEVPSQEVPVAVVEGARLHFTACGEGCFVALGAMDVESAPGIRHLEVRVGGESRNLALLVKRVRFPEERITLPKEKVFLSPEDRARAEEEAARLRALFGVVSERSWEGAFLMPLENPVSTPFGVRRVMNKTKRNVHRGIDIRGKTGDNIKASNSGRVVLAEELLYGGHTVVVDHGQGVFTMYMHLSESVVKEGDPVGKGDTVGLVGSSGRSSGPHLHFGVKVGGVSANPPSLIALDL